MSIQKNISTGIMNLERTQKIKINKNLISQQPPRTKQGVTCIVIVDLSM